MTSCFEPGESWLPELLALHARYRPNHPALSQGDRVLDWRAFGNAINAAAAAFVASGVAVGDRIAVLGQVTMETIVWEFGGLRAGGTVVAISTMVSDEALMGMIDDAGVGHVVANAEQGGRVERLRADRSLLIMDGDKLPPPSATQFVPPVISGQTRFMIMYSSGTTGRPKGILHTHRSRMDYGSIMASAVGASSDTIALITTPLCSNMSWTSLIFTLMEGGTVILDPKFDAGRFIQTVNERRVTHALLVPTQFLHILDHPSAATADMASLEMICTTGSAMPPPLKRRAIARFEGQFCEMYGMTEGFATMLRQSDMRANPASAGRPMRANDIRIVDDQDGEVAQGASGEIVARSPMLMVGYHNDLERTAEAIWTDPSSGHGFIRSGDIGRIDEDGFVHIVGRKKDMIISGGQNIYAVDLERVLSDHPLVRETAVIAVPHPTWGETPVALVVLQRDAPVSAEDLRDWANARLGRHERLTAIEFRDELPRNAGGKLMKAELRASYVTDPE